MGDIERESAKRRDRERARYIYREKREGLEENERRDLGGLIEREGLYRTKQQILLIAFTSLS